MNPDEKMISAQRAYDNQLPPEPEDNSEYFQQQAKETLDIVKDWIQNNFDKLVDGIVEKTKLSNTNNSDAIPDKLIECVSINATIGARFFISNSHKSQAKQEVMETLLRLECDPVIVDFLTEHFEEYYEKDNDFDSAEFAQDIIKLIKSEFLTKEN